MAGSGSVGGGALILMLFVGIGVGMIVQRFKRSRRDLAGARSFVKSASRAHWRGSFPRLVVWLLGAAFAMLVAVRVMVGR